MSDRELKKLFAEIEGSLPTEERTDVPYIVPRKVRRINPKQLKIARREFAKLAESYEKTKGQIEVLTKKRRETEERMTKVVQKHGVAIRERDLALYSHPFKGQIIHKRSSGSIDSDVLREHAVLAGVTDLFTFGEEKLDMKKFENFVRNEKMSEVTRKHLLSMLDQFRQIARNPKCNALQAEELLDMVRYDEMKQKGEIPADVIAKAEQVQWSQGSIRVDRIIRPDNKCSGCAATLPKENHKGERVCLRCGTIHDQKKK